METVHDIEPGTHREVTHDSGHLLFVDRFLSRAGRHGLLNLGCSSGDDVGSP